jgi:GTP-binding protein EngB required for normal cell division
VLGSASSNALRNLNRQIEEQNKIRKDHKNEIDKLVKKNQKSIEEITSKHALEQERLLKDFKSTMDKLEEEKKTLDLKINELTEKYEIKSLDQLEGRDKKLFDDLVELFRRVPAAPLDKFNFLVGSRHIGFFGNTSVGKSTLINSCLTLGDVKCATGRGETTKEACPHQSPSQLSVYWDLPGSNDELSYLKSTLNMSLLKRLDVVFVTVAYTIKEMSDIIKLLERLNIKYHIIVNKFDEVEPQEIVSFTNSIKNEINGMNLNNNQGLHFISGKNASIGDWIEFQRAVVGLIQ